MWKKTIWLPNYDLNGNVPLLTPFWGSYAERLRLIAFLLQNPKDKPKRAEFIIKFPVTHQIWLSTLPSAKPTTIIESPTAKSNSHSVTKDIQA